jgi:S-adenosyl-L-methionine hydrolase (adenosine-forming)
MPPIVTLTTDFGTVYPAIMKGVMLSIDPDIYVIDVTDSIPSGDIVQGAFILHFASAYFPPGTIHVAVVDPGVGGERRALVIKGERYTFVGPDNGLLMPAARAQGDFKVYEITDLEFYTRPVSPVFHGRDIFAPAAAFLSTGRVVPGLKQIGDPVDLYFGVPRLVDDLITGKVLFVDTFGNVVTNISRDVIMGLCHHGQMLDVNGVLMPFLRTYCESEKLGLLALIGSHGMMEIACSGDSAADMMSLKSGDSVSIQPQ